MPIYSFAGNGENDTSKPEEIVSAEYACTLTISGYGNVEGLGRIPVTLTATEDTCEEAAANLRPQIIAMEICDHPEAH